MYGCSQKTKEDAQEWGGDIKNGVSNTVDLLQNRVQHFVNDHSI